MIAPNTTVILLKGIPFDNTYEHTVSYANRQAQFNDLTQGIEGETKYTLSNMTYQRHTRNSIRVQMPIEQAFQCNYMCFRNTNYVNSNNGKGWIYAFITNVEYVNDVTSEIFYEIDVMQSFFLFDTVKEMSFIEREHTATDNIGDNIVEENLSVGEYIFENYQKLETALDDMTIVLSVVETENVTIKNYDNVVSGCTLYGYRNNENGRIALQQKLQTYIQKPEAVISLYVVPTIIIEDIDTSTNIIANDKSGAVFNLAGEKLDGDETFGSETDGSPIVPKNKKLYTYPFNFYHVENNSGNAIDLRYELFNNYEPTFECYGCFTQPVSVVMHPTNYKLAQIRTTDVNFSEVLELNNYPICSWSNDTYKNWLSNNAIPIALNSIAPIIQTLSGITSVNTISVGNRIRSATPISNDLTGITNSSLYNFIADTMTQNYRASIKADVLRGSISSTNVNLAHRAHNFYGARVRITSEYMKIIDEFFSMFGYAVKRVKDINIRNRKHWTYIKTNGANLHGNCGNEYNKRMVNILDNGITFWTDSISKVCNYSLINEPLGGN